MMPFLIANPYQGGDYQLAILNVFNPGLNGDNAVVSQFDPSAALEPNALILSATTLRHGASPYNVFQMQHQVVNNVIIFILFCWCSCAVVKT
jgi:hypothetical protein